MSITSDADKFQILFVNYSIRESSGGRTQSMFLRGKMLAEMGHDVCFATFNHNPSYYQTRQAFISRYNLDSTFKFANIHEFLAQEQLYDQPLQGEFLTEESDVFKTEGVPDFEEEGCRQTVENRETDIVVRRYIGQKLISSKIYSCTGKLVAAKEFRYPGNVKKQSFYTTDGRCYLERYFSEQGEEMLCRWLKRDGTAKDVANYSVLKHLWISKLNSERSNPLFFVDDRKYDAVTIDNLINHDIRVVGTVHSCFFDAPFRAGAPYRAYYRHIMETSDRYSAVVFLTQSELDDACDYIGMRSNLFAIPHPNSIERFAQTLKRDNKSVVMMTRLSAIKRVDHAIRAMAIVATKDPSIVLHIYGKGHEEEQLKDLCAELNLQENVVFEGYTHEPLAAFASSGAMVMTSEYEGFGLSLLEALSVGTPCIAYDFNYGPRDIIDDGVNGTIVEYGNIEMLAQAILDVLGNEDQLARMSENAKTLPKSLQYKQIRTKMEEMLTYISNCPAQETYGDSSLFTLAVNIDSASLNIEDGKQFVVNLQVSATFFAEPNPQLRREDFCLHISEFPHHELLPFQHVFASSAEIGEKQADIDFVLRLNEEQLIALIDDSYQLSLRIQHGKCSQKRRLARRLRHCVLGCANSCNDKEAIARILQKTRFASLVDPNVYENSLIFQMAGVRSINNRIARTLQKVTNTQVKGRIEGTRAHFEGTVKAKGKTLLGGVFDGQLFACPKGRQEESFALAPVSYGTLPDGKLKWTAEVDLKSLSPLRNAPSGKQYWDLWMSISLFGSESVHLEGFGNMVSLCIGNLTVISYQGQKAIVNIPKRQ